jgi:hypothetical protein
MIRNRGNTTAKKVSGNPLTRWSKANEVVAAALREVKVGTDAGERPLPPDIAKRIINDVKNGTVPIGIADLCTLSCALEDHGVSTPDVDAIYQAASGAWQMRILAAAAGKGN